jgi:hypothetical protein
MGNGRGEKNAVSVTQMSLDILQEPWHEPTRKDRN